MEYSNSGWCSDGRKVVPGEVVVEKRKWNRGAVGEKVAIYLVDVSVRVEFETLLEHSRSNFPL